MKATLERSPPPKRPAKTLRRPKAARRGASDAKEERRMAEHEQLLAKLETLGETQEELEHSQQLYAELFDLAPFGYVSLTAKGVIQTANRAAAMLVNSFSRDLTGQKFMHFVAGRDQQTFKQHLARCRAAEQGEVVTELQLWRKKGVSRPVVELRSRHTSLLGRSAPIYCTVLRDITDRRLAEAAFRVSEDRFRALVENSAEGVCIFDPESKIAYVGPSVQQMLGYAPEELLEQPACAFVHPEELAKVRRTWHKIVRTPGFLLARALNRVRDQRGEWRWIEYSLHNLQANPAIGGILCHFRDVHERHAAMEALRQNEEQFRRAIEEAPIPVIMHAEDGQVLQISRTWTALTGYTREMIPTFGAWLNRAYGPGADYVRDYVRQLFSGDKHTVDIEMDVQTKNHGPRRWIFSASAPGALRDGRRFVVGMAVDITDRRRAEDALRSSQQRLRLIVENARDYAICTTDLDRRITTWNAGAQAILGYSEAEVLGLPVDLIFTPEDRATGVPAAETKKAIAEDRASDERWHLRKDGSRFWGSGVMMAMRSGAGTAVGLLKIFRDETVRLEAKRALEEHREQLWEALQENESVRADLEAANQAKDRFLAMLSHELRTPLTPVMLGLYGLASRKDLPAPVYEELEVMQRNVNLEVRFINDLLDVTRIVRGNMEIVTEPMDLHEAVQRAVEVTQGDLAAKNQRLSVALEARECQVNGDFGRLQQAFWNLLKNASKFTPEGGELRIASHNEARTNGAGVGHIVVEVSDTGIGMETEVLSRIFRPFEQVDESIARRFGGLGLGLAIAKATVDVHGGALSAHSAGRDAGSTFRVDLPLAGTARKKKAGGSLTSRAKV